MDETKEDIKLWKKYVTDTLDKTNDKVDEADVDTLEAGIGSTFGQNYTVNDW